MFVYLQSDTTNLLLFMENQNKMSVRGAMRALPVGGAIIVRVGEMTYSGVRNTASTLGLELNRNYSVHLNRSDRVYEITRRS